MPDYKSNADQIAAQRINANNSDQASLFQALMGQRNQRNLQQADAEAKMGQMQEQEQQGIRNLGLVEQRAKANPEYDYTLSGESVKKHRPEVNQMGMLNYELRKQAELRRQQDDRDKKVHQVATDYRNANIPATMNTLEDVNKNVPGGLAGKGDLKSVGGFKNLVPDFLVGAAEGVGILPQGAGAERSSIRNLSNTVVYDASGKAINENEMKRLQSGMAMLGFSKPDDIRDSINRFGNTVVDKGKTVEQGANPDALATLQERGVRPVSGLEALLKPRNVSAITPGGAEAAAAKQQGFVKEVRNKKTGKVGKLYSDGTVRYE